MSKKMILNPQSGRFIGYGGPTHRRLIRDGILENVVLEMNQHKKKPKKERRKHQKRKPIKRKPIKRKPIRKKQTKNPVSKSRRKPQKQYYSSSSETDSWTESDETFSDSESYTD